ncbi:MAG: helix-turn-helix domain-containing protein [Pseudonocardiaceae bacterium]
MDETTLGGRLREIRSWHQLSLRDAAGAAGLSVPVWGQVERGDKPVASRHMLEAMARALRVHPIELTGQPWAPQDVVSSEAHAGLWGIEIALERYELGVDPEDLTVAAWPQIAADLERLEKLRHYSADYAAQGELTPALLGQLHAAYVRMPEYRREVLLGLISAYSSAAMMTKRLGVRGLPTLAARAVAQCAQALDEPVWLGYAAWLRGGATGLLDRAAQYRRCVAAAQTLASRLDSSDALQACGMLHLSAALAAAAQADHDTTATHLEEAAALAARMDTEVGTWANLWFGPVNVGIWRTSLAVELGEPGQAVQAAKAVHPELLPNSRQAQFWADLGRALIATKKTREKGVRVLLHAEQLAPQLIYYDVFAREAIADLLRQARRDAGGRELRGLAWRLGVTPIG